MGRTPAPLQFGMLVGQPFTASGVSEVELLPHNPFGAWPCVSGCAGKLVCVSWHAMDVASRVSDAQWFAEPCDCCKEELGRRM